MKTWQWRSLLAAVVVLAAVTRLWDLGNYPPGLFPDQAANGVDALDILHGKFQVFSPRNNGRESLFFTIQAVMIGMFDVGVWQMFLASAVVGVATVAATYAAASTLFGRGPALLSALFLATNPWHVTLSRTGFRAVTTPFFIALSLLLLSKMLRAVRTGPRYAFAVAAGIATGLGLYTYPSYRAYLLFVGLVFAAAAFRLVFQTTARQRYRPFVIPALVTGAVTLFTALPLLVFFATYPTFVSTRAAHVSLWNPDLNDGHPGKTFLRMTGRTLRGFLWEGDGNPRHNVPLPRLWAQPGQPYRYDDHQSGGGLPFLTPLPAVLAVIGAITAARQYPWLLLLFGVMLLPATLTAQGIPHGLRTVGTIPAHVWLAGLGGVWFWRVFRKNVFPRRPAHSVAVAVLVIALTMGLDLWAYFGIARNSPLAHYEYRADLTVVSEYLNALARGARSVAPVPYLVLDDFSVKTVAFLTTKAGRPYRLLRPEESHRQLLEVGEEILFTQSTLPDAERYLQMFPGVHVKELRKNRFRETIMVVITR